MKNKKLLALALAASVFALTAMPMAATYASSNNEAAGVLGVTGGSPINVAANNDKFTIELTIADVFENYSGIRLRLDYNSSVIQMSGPVKWETVGGFYGEDGLTMPDPMPTDPNDVTEWLNVSGLAGFAAPNSTPTAICTIDFNIVAPAGTAVDEIVKINNFALAKTTATETDTPGYPIFTGDYGLLFDDLNVRVIRPGPGGPTGPTNPGGGTTGPGGSTNTGGNTGTTPVTPDDDGTSASGTSGNGETNINEGETPLGVSFFTAHVQYIFGYPDGSVQPDASITRAEAVSIFFRLIDDDDKEAAIPNAFFDVPADEWYAQSVSYAAKMQIVLGYPDGGFHPEDRITRAEFATIMSRFVPSGAPSASRFSDVPSDHWASGFIDVCAANGWIMGYPDGTFQPESPISRAEVVTVLNRALNRGIAIEDMPQTIPSYIDLPTNHWAYADVIEASAPHDFTRGADGNEIWN